MKTVLADVIECEEGDGCESDSDSDDDEEEAADNTEPDFLLI